MADQDGRVSSGIQETHEPAGKASEDSSQPQGSTTTSSTTPAISSAGPLSSSNFPSNENDASMPDHDDAPSRPVAGTPTSKRPRLTSGDSAEKEKMCRYCFDGEEDGELISPCACKGGQKFVHLNCLRRWQRRVLVTQPTHPSLWDRDVRHQVEERMMFIQRKIFRETLVVNAPIRSRHLQRAISTTNMYRINHLPP